MNISTRSSESTWPFRLKYTNQGVEWAFSTGARQGHGFSFLPERGVHEGFFWEVL